MTMDLRADDLRQPTCHEGLGTAMEIYLRDRVRAAAAGSAVAMPRHLEFKLYQCLGDGRSAEALCEDLLELAAEPHSSRQSVTGLVAVFECATDSEPADDADRPGFATLLAQHLTLLRHQDHRVDTAAALQVPDEERLTLTILGHRYRLIVMHPDAERLARVMPCPVLVFLPIESARPTAH